MCVGSKPTRQTSLFCIIARGSPRVRARAELDSHLHPDLIGVDHSFIQTGKENSAQVMSGCAVSSRALRHLTAPHPPCSLRRVGMAGTM